MTEVLRFCTHTENKSLNILVVGNEHIIQPLSASILQANNSEKLISELKVHKCENVQQVLSSGRPCAHVDYIAFCIDSRSPKVTEQIEEGIECLNKTFLFSRICLIMCQFGSMPDFDVNTIINLRNKYQLHQINGETNNEEGRLLVSTRLLRLVSYACGLATGYPVVEHFYEFPVHDEESDEFYDASTSVLTSDEDI